MAAPAVAAHHGHHEHRVGAPPGAQPSGVYRPRRPRASPLYGLLDRRFRHLSLVYDEQFAHTYGPWRAVVPAVVDRLLAATPGGSPAGPSGWTKRSSPPSRTATDGGFRPDSTFVRWPGWPAYDG